MILQGAEEVEENLAGDLEGLDQVPLLEDGVGDARQRLLVRQLGDSEHVDAPLFRILQDLRRITIITITMGLKMFSRPPWQAQLHVWGCPVQPRIEARSNH